METEPFKRYYQVIEEKLNKAFRQKSEIRLAATWIAQCIQSGGWIYTSGTGHSHMMAEEIFYRAGGFARVRPILDPPLMLHADASGSTEIERKEGYAEQLLKDYQMNEKDVFIISSNSGRNPVSIEMAQLAQKAGTKVITITNLSHSKSVDSRHSSGSKLFQVSDVFLDNCGEIGDASIEFEGFSSRVGATSTVIGAALLQAILVQAVGMLLEEGNHPEIFNSSNSDQGEAENELLIEKYKPKVKGL
ncbi:SIS domain-containing protein [Algoriphagus confluentis]|uniref:Sugar isomerase domain-containing protein n=1 Tax=Algoriphagus confluentis TaxID=1697556 RepID=A0ABQ6PNG3_9BACT|nr:sugar isomerase domain-containing protein [Algoriphagus confluentis]